MSGYIQVKMRSSIPPRNYKLWHRYYYTTIRNKQRDCNQFEFLLIDKGDIYNRETLTPGRRYNIGTAWVNCPGIDSFVQIELDRMPTDDLNCVFRAVQQSTKWRSILLIKNSTRAIFFYNAETTEYDSFRNYLLIRHISFQHRKNESTNTQANKWKSKQMKK